MNILKIRTTYKSEGKKTHNREVNRSAGTNLVIQILF